MKKTLLTLVRIFLSSVMKSSAASFSMSKKKSWHLSVFTSLMMSLFSIWLNPTLALKLCKKAMVYLPSCMYCVVVIAMKHSKIPTWNFFWQKVVRIKKRYGNWILFMIWVVNCFQICTVSFSSETAKVGYLLWTSTMGVSYSRTCNMKIELDLKGGLRTDMSVICYFTFHFRLLIQQIEKNKTNSTCTIWFHSWRQEKKH